MSVVKNSHFLRYRHPPSVSRDCRRAIHLPRSRGGGSFPAWHKRGRKLLRSGGGSAAKARKLCGSAQAGGSFPARQRREQEAGMAENGGGLARNIPLRTSCVLLWAVLYPPPRTRRSRIVELNLPQDQTGKGAHLRAARAESEDRKAGAPPRERGAPRSASLRGARLGCCTTGGPGITATGPKGAGAKIPLSACEAVEVPDGRCGWRPSLRHATGPKDITPSPGHRDGPGLWRVCALPAKAGGHIRSCGILRSTASPARAPSRRRANRKPPARHARS